MNSTSGTGFNLQGHNLQGKMMSDIEREIELENMAAYAADATSSEFDDFLDGVAPACNLGEACESCQ